MTTPKKPQREWLQRPRMNAPLRAVQPAKADPGQARLIAKADVRKITGTSYPTLWDWMRHGKFPRSRIVGGRSMWLSTEVEAWLADLPVRRLKGDAEVAA